MNLLVVRTGLYFLAGIVAFILDIKMDYWILISLFGLLISFLLFFLARERAYIFLYPVFLLGFFYSSRVYNAQEGLDLYNRKLLVESRLIEKQEDLLIVRTSSIDGRKLRKKIRLKNLGDQDYSLGSKIDFEAEFKRPRTRTNPKLFDYRNYLYSKNFFLAASLKDENVLRLEEAANIYLLRQDFRDYLVATMDKYLGSYEADFLKSVILGDRSYLEEARNQGYRDLGLAHVLAVSGLHIGILSFFIRKILALLGLPKNPRLFINIIFIWAYGFLIGFPLSILRANIIISIDCLARIFDQPDSYLNSLFLGLLLILIGNPFALMDLSFLLSFGSSLSLIFIGDYLNRSFNYRNNPVLASFFMVLAVFIGILPIEAYYFNEISLSRFLSNMILLPIYSLMLILGFLLLFFEKILPGLNLILGKGLLILGKLEAFILNRILGLGLRKAVLSSPDLVHIASYYLLILLILNLDKFRKISRKTLAYINFLLLGSLVLIPADYLINQQLIIDFIDVGQGDSILLRTRNKNFLFDTGGEIFGDYSVGENISLPYLRKNNVKALDGVFISHYHKDHCLGLLDLDGKIRMDRIFLAYINKEEALIDQLENKERLEVLRAGDLMDLDRDLSLRILSPDRDYYSENENNMSLVGLIEYGDFSLLLTGDIEAEIERKILDSYSLEEIDVLKLPHHGSKTSSSREFIEELRPSYGIIQLGENNFKHPDPKVLEDYRSVGTRIIRTDESGNIRIIVTRRGYEIREYLLEEKLLKNLFLMVLYMLLGLEILRFEAKYTRRKEYYFELHRFK